MAEAPNDDLPTLPPQYSQGNLGFFTRVTESVPTALTTGPDGALYVAELTGIPYPEGYARVLRVGDPDAVTGFDGDVPSGVPQTYASGFDEIHSIGFDAQKNLYVLEYKNSNEVYDPTIPPEELPLSRLIKVAPDGERTLISGEELKLGNYLLVDKASGDIFVSINNTTATNGQVLRYSADPATGEYEATVVAEGLNSPRGLSFGPDGNLYVLEQGLGTPQGAPGFEDAPVLELIPGLVGQRGGYSGSITRVDLEGSGGQERVYEGLPSFQEFNPTTGEDRVLGIGVRGFTITEDGAVYIASGGGLSEESAAAAGEVGQDLRGVLRLDGLFGPDPGKAEWTRLFDSVAYAGQNGPDGATTAFNTQSNLNDITVGADGELYAVDAARNVLYGLGADGAEAESVTVLQKRPPVLTPPQYSAVVEAGGDPAADYRVEIDQRTEKGPDGLPDTPGRREALAGNPGAPEAPGAPGGPGAPTVPPPRGEDFAGRGGETGGAPGTPGGAPPGNSPGASPADPPSGPPTGSPGAPPGPPGLPPPGGPTIPGPVDPQAPPVLADNVYAGYFDPFFGGYAPAAGDLLELPSEGSGTYAASNVYSFGDRLADDGGKFGAYPLAERLGVETPFADPPYDEAGSFTDGPKWTENLARILGVPEGDDTNFAYKDATARAIDNPLDPLQDQTSLTDFQGQIDRFEQTGRSFEETDLVTVTFGGNDITLPDKVSPEEGVTRSVGAIVDGLERLNELGAEHFLVANIPDVTLAPIFSDPAFQEALGAEPGAFEKLVDRFNAELGSALEQFEEKEGVDVKELDLNKLFDGIAADPASYGFTNIEEPVLANPPTPGQAPVYDPAIVGQDPAVQHGSLFLDPFFDPTALGHAVIAETARDALLGGSDEMIA